MANSCSKDCATTESQTIPFWKRRCLKQGSQVGTARQAHRVLSTILAAATVYSLSWDPSSVTLTLIFTQLHQLQPLIKNRRSLVTLSTSISECTERRGIAKPENRSLPWLCPCSHVVRMIGPSRKNTPRKGDAEAMEKTQQYCTPLARTEL